MTRRRTIEWQVCGRCNYACSYCIQKPARRVGEPDAATARRFVDFFAGLPEPWEVKMSGGEPFACPAFLDEIVPGLVDRTPHTVSVLTNLSAPRARLERFAALTRGRLGIVSASLHLEHTTVPAFLERALALRAAMDPSAALVVNAVLVPGRLEAVAAAARQVTGAGLRFFPQLLKVGRGVHRYSGADQALVTELVGTAPAADRANLAPSYRGRRCWSGLDYVVVAQDGGAWSCRSARRAHEGLLGNVLDGTFARWTSPRECPYELCPCTVPANRGMIEGELRAPRAGPGAAEVRR